ncbi:MAG: hypothetical protein ACR2PR_09205 [Pseudohongiellaceae bacterium]
MRQRARAHSKAGGVMGFCDYIKDLFAGGYRPPKDGCKQCKEWKPRKGKPDDRGFCNRCFRPTDGCPQCSGWEQSRRTLSPNWAYCNGCGRTVAVKDGKAIAVAA